MNQHAKSSNATPFLKFRNCLQWKNKSVNSLICWKKINSDRENFKFGKSR